MRVKQLDTLRIFAILTIALSHLYFLSGFPIYDIWSKYFNNPIWGVNYFFILSGFGIYLKLSKSSEQVKGIHFAINQIKKIYLVYIITCLVCIPYSIIKDMEDSVFIVAVIKAIIKFIGCCTLLQSGSGTTISSHALNSVCWFLSCLFICYIFCPITVKLINSLSKKYKYIGIFGALSSAIIIVITSFIAKEIENKVSIFNDIEYGSPYVRFWYLVLGMFLAVMYQGFIHKKLFIINLIEIPLTIILLLDYFCRQIFNFSWLTRICIDVCLPAITIFVFSVGGGIVSNFLSVKVFANISKYTNYIFLWHFPIIIYVWLLYEYINKSTNIWSIIGILLTVILTATIVLINIKIDKHKKDA